MIQARRRWLRHAAMVGRGFLPALLVLPVAAELIQDGRSPLREARHGECASSVELAGEPRRAAREPRPRRPVVEAPRRVYLGEPPRGGSHQASDEAVVLHPPRQPLEQYLPMVKLAPVYPREAAMACIEGWALLEFMVTAMGTVRDPIVIEASPAGVFDGAAITAAREFRYVPKVWNGEAVDVHGARYLMRFELPGEDCPRLDSGIRERVVDQAERLAKGLGDGRGLGDLLKGVRN